MRIYRARTAQRGVRLLRDQLSAFAYGFPLPKWSTVQRFVLESLVDDEFITVEIDDNGCGRLKFELFSRKRILFERPGMTLRSLPVANRQVNLAPWR